MTCEVLGTVRAEPVPCESQFTLELARFGPPSSSKARQGEEALLRNLQAPPALSGREIAVPAPCPVALWERCAWVHITPRALSILSCFTF